MGIRKITSIKLNISNLLVVLFSLISIISCLAIYHGDTTLVASNIPRLVTIFVVGLTLLCLATTMLNINNIESNIAFAIPMIYLLVTILNKYEKTVVSLYSILAIFLFLLAKREIRKKVFENYRRFLFLMCFAGIICWALYIVGIRFMAVEVPFYSKNIGGTYVNYYVSYLCTDLNTPLIRLCGLFNEPGYLGTVVAFFLCADDLKLDNWIDRIFLIAGILSFSLAFFVIIAIYLFLKAYNKPKIMLIVGILLFTYLFVLPHINFSNSFINYVVRRITITGGTFAGDNRSNIYIDNYLHNLLVGSKKWFGMGAGFSQVYFYGTNFATIKTYIIDYGIIGTALLFVPIFFVGIKYAYKKFEAVFFVIIFSFSIYQRPHIFNLLYFMILFGGIEYILDRNQ